MIANTTTAATAFRVYFGTQAKRDACGIYMALFDTQTGQLGEAVRVSDSARPGYIVIHPDGKHIYATEASGSAPGGDEGFVSAYRIDEPSGKLIDLNTQPTGARGPCHLSFDPSGKHLLVATYHEASCTTFPIRPDGTLGEAAEPQRHSGSGPNPKRQEAAHAHSINCSPDGRFAFVPDLGMDKIMIYQLTDGVLTPSKPPFVATAPGSGPRHLTIHPSGKFVYACMELSNTVVAYEYADGKLTEIQTLPTLPPDFTEQSTTAEICLTPDGRFLYVSNRGHESLAIFKVDPETGKLTAIGYEPTRGNHPRNFNIDPTGQFLIAANAHTDNVVVFRINQETGLLEFTGSEITVPVPSCVKFLRIQE